ncbi:MAG: peptide ABC transporter substrate-binding protein [Candidatus Eremiobacteraeota bacterium]|nr:peptide ABC transporter substrate-binding protein [Candidatus Eremiobacteraeota bacterium]
MISFLRRTLALAALLGIVLGGCTKSATSVSATAGSAAGSSAPAARHPWTRPGHLVIGAAGEEPDTLNKLFANTDAADQIAQFIFEPIFRYDQHGDYFPAAAREVPTLQNRGITPDGRTITLHFRPGMKWSDGAPYDARDLLFTWHAVMNPRNNTRLTTGWDDIAAIDLPDPLTAVVHLKQPYGGILGIFAEGGAGYPPLPAHLLASLPDLNHAPFNSRPLSSGPFILERWNHGASIEMVANPTYWRGRPKLDRVTYRIIPNADTLFLALQTHDVDLFDSVNENQIDRLKTLQGIIVTKTLIANVRRLQFNTSKPVLHDVRVRRAVAEAVDWDRINQTVYHGYNQRAASDFFPLSWAAPTGISAPPHDPADAAKLLDAAGWKPGPNGIRTKAGARLTFSVSTTVSKPANTQAELQMKQDLLPLGIDLEIKNYQTSLLFAQSGPVYSGKFDSEFTIETQAPDPDNEGLWSGKMIPPHGANTSWLNDPILTQTSHDANLTFDRAKRKALYQREAERIAELVPAVYLYWQNSFAGVNSDLRNWKPTSYISDYWNCWEWSL